MKEFSTMNLHSGVTRNGEKVSNMTDRNKQGRKGIDTNEVHTHTHTHTHTHKTLKKKKTKHN